MWIELSPGSSLRLPVHSVLLDLIRFSPSPSEGNATWTDPYANHPLMSAPFTPATLWCPMRAILWSTIPVNPEFTLPAHPSSSYCTWTPFSTQFSPFVLFMYFSFFLSISCLCGITQNINLRRLNPWCGEEGGSTLYPHHGGVRSRVGGQSSWRRGSDKLWNVKDQFLPHVSALGDQRWAVSRHHA